MLGLNKGKVAYSDWAELKSTEAVVLLSNRKKVIRTTKNQRFITFLLLLGAINTPVLASVKNTSYAPSSEWYTRFSLPHYRKQLLDAGGSIKITIENRLFFPELAKQGW
ncbi:hypothetical protein [Thiolinea disciformis]|uniref:hypothetical protein n=1 Tax=Thiolinea disciformis TaxID=125614 RepID=UPI0012FF1C72|nr:hypothetical protein [Thiolinea disciformis]